MGEIQTPLVVINLEPDPTLGMLSDSVEVAMIKEGEDD